MAWSAAHELALTKRHIAEEETLRIVQLTRIADQMRHRQDIAAAEQALRHAEADLTALRARLRLCRGYQRAQRRAISRKGHTWLCDERRVASMSDPRPQPASAPAGAPLRAAGRTDGRMRRVGRWMLAEAKRIAGIFAYLWIVFGLFILHEHVVLSRHGMGHGFYGLAFINAWILAKIMLVAESLDVRPHFQGRPLVYPILARSCAFAVLLVCAYALEEIAPGFWRGGTLADSMPAIGGGGIRGLWSVILIMVVALIPYFAFREVGRVLGRERLQTLLFRDGAAIDVVDKTGMDAA